MAKYIIKHTSILHNKKVYAENSIIELKDEDANRLKEFLELVPETAKSKSNKDTSRTKTKVETKAENNVENTTSTNGNPEGENNDK